jgi:CBS domain-containing protein
MTCSNSATVQHIVTGDAVVALDANVSIRDAARLMAQRNIGSVGVRQDGKLVGLVTERDLVVRVLANGGDSSRPMREAMRPDLPRVPVTATETECTALMRDHGTRHLLVEDGDEVVGVVSMRDIIRCMLEERQFLVEQLATYINGHGAREDSLVAPLW